MKFIFEVHCPDIACVDDHIEQAKQSNYLTRIQIFNAEEYFPLKNGTYVYKPFKEYWYQ